MGRGEVYMHASGQFSGSACRMICLPDFRIEVFKIVFLNGHIVKQRKQTLVFSNSVLNTIKLNSRCYRGKTKH